MGELCIHDNILSGKKLSLIEVPQKNTKLAITNVDGVGSLINARLLQNIAEPSNEVLQTENLSMVIAPKWLKSILSGNFTMDA